MSDERLRELARRVAGGDESALAALKHERCRRRGNTWETVGIS